ncbi:MAG: YicC family protein, partial [Tissierellia bacterium]|nr:YicC family protein [Tissierellia bacterium]
PKSLFFLDDELKKIITKDANRGKIDIFIDIKSKGIYDMSLEIDYSLLDLYKNNLNVLIEYLKIDNNFQIFDLLAYDKDILSSKRVDLSENELFVTSCIECVTKASSNFLEMRIQEGYNIEYDLNTKLKELSLILDKIELVAKDVVNANVNSLKERILEILNQDNVKLDEDRLINEIVFYTDKLSIDEEIVRLKSHINLFKNILVDDISSGKKLDFLIQEMNRETNTIGSKSASIDITNFIIEMKSIIEKMREQVQNIE